MEWNFFSQHILDTIFPISSFLSPIKSSPITIQRVWTIFLTNQNSSSHLHCSDFHERNIVRCFSRSIDVFCWKWWKKNVEIWSMVSSALSDWSKEKSQLIERGINKHRFIYCYHQNGDVDVVACTFDSHFWSWIGSIELKFISIFFSELLFERKEKSSSWTKLQCCWVRSFHASIRRWFVMHQPPVEPHMP